MTETKQKWVRAVALSLLPIFEMAVLRFYFHYVLKIKTACGFFVDEDLLIPVPASLILFFSLLQLEKPAVFAIQRTCLALNVILFAILASQSPFDPRLWWVTFALLMLSAMSSFTPPSFIWRNKYRSTTLPCAMIGVSQVINQNFSGRLWRLLLPWVGGGACGLLKIPVHGVECLSSTRTFTIRVSDFGIKIGKGCSGFDAFYLFLFSFAILYILNPRRVSRSTWLFFAPLGLLLMHFLNLLRIASIFALGVYLERRFSWNVSQFVALSLYHLNAGWILYLTGIALYLRAFLNATDNTSRIIEKRPLPFKSSSPA